MSSEVLAIETRNLSRDYPHCCANWKINLKVRSSSIHAVIGENGAGKSTLMKLLFGLENPTDGEVFVNGKKVNFRNALDAIASGIGMVQQHFTLVENSTAIENVVLGSEVSRFGILDLNKSIADLESRLPSPALRVPWNTKVEELSVGFRQRVEILKVIYRNAQIMIFDEPTAVLTPQEVEDFYQILLDLKNAGRTIVLITHKIEDVLKYADDYTVLRRGEVQGSGSVSQTSADDLVHMIVGRELKPIVISPVKSQEVLLKIENFGAEVFKGEILGVAGIEGSGQASLVAELLKNNRRDIAYIPEDRQSDGVWMQADMASNLIPGREDEFFSWGFLDSKKIDQSSQRFLKEFDVRTPNNNSLASELSGGNQQKLVLARELCERKIKFIVCHQPTRGVDIGAIERIHQCLINLRDQGISTVLISSDLDELFSLSDRLIVLFQGKISAEFTRKDFDRIKVGKAMTGNKNA